MTEYPDPKTWLSNVVIAVGVALLLFSLVALGAGISMVATPPGYGIPGAPWEAYVMVSVAAAVVMGLGAIALGIGWNLRKQIAS